MVAIVSTVAYLGLEARAVEVQVQLIAGLPAFNVVGLGDKAVGESRERVRGAIAAMGLALPPKRIAVNLSPKGPLQPWFLMAARLVADSGVRVVVHGSAGNMIDGERLEAAAAAMISG